MTQEIEFRVLRFGNGTYHWHLETADHQVIAWSGQAHESKQTCVNELYWIRDNVAAIPVYDYTGEARLPPGRRPR
jgi:uncharacterized protein YegP (UPF0339 family)